MMDTATKGITSILIKWIKIVPRGANIAALSPITTPTIVPKTIATTI